MYSLVACLSHLTIDHASLSIPSTVPTPNRHLQHLGAHYFLIHMLHRNVLLILSPSCFAVCGHHLSPRIKHAVPPCIFHILPQIVGECEFYSTALPQGHICASSSSSPRVLVYLFFLAGPDTYTKSQFQRFRVVHWAVQIRFHSYFFS